MSKIKMKLNMALKPPLRNLKNSCKINPAFVISGFLTLLYCVEYSIGIRTIYITFKLWNDPSVDRSKKHVNWTLCLACILTATITSFTVNILSAVWEQKQLEEKGRPKSFFRFLGHFIVGGMLWRYFNLLCLASKQYYKKNSLLLTMTKFFFTQTFTIPMVIIHVSVTQNIDEMIYAFVNIFCISFNLILTCTMFSVCYKEVEELKKWDYETVDLIPLLFQWDPPVPTNNNFKVSSNFSGKEDPRYVKKESNCEKIFEEIVIKTLVLIQSFGFSLGRLMALGILVKLAGIYAVSIMFLQLLISVIYLKFQAPILVSDTLPKWRQLTRLAFLGYILIFEWHLNREPRTAYDFSFNMKHNILYYCVATVESVFYLVTWTITTSILSKNEIPEIRDQQNGFCRIVLIIGSLSLVFSLSIHVLLLFWRSRRISRLFYHFRRRYEKTKIRLSRYGGRNNVAPQEKQFRRPPISHIDISNPIPLQRSDMSPSRMHAHPQNQTSYRDLREPLDEEIEIFRKCDNRSRSNPKLRDIRRGGVMSDQSRRETIQAIDHVLREEVNNYQNARYSYDRRLQQAPHTPTIVTSQYSSPGNRSQSGMHKTNTGISSMQEHSLKSRVSLLSDNISGHLEKMSRKISGAVKEHFAKKKDPLGNYASSSKTTDVKTRSPYASPSNYADVHRKVPSDTVSLHRGYYVGETRCYRIEYSPSQASAIHQHISPGRYGGDGRSPSLMRSPSPMRTPLRSPMRSPMGSSSQMRISSPMKSPSSMRSSSPIRSSSPVGSSSPVRSSSPMHSSSPRVSPSHRLSPSPGLSPSAGYYDSPKKSPGHSPSPAYYESPRRSPGVSPSHGYHDSSKKSPDRSGMESPPPKITPSPMFSSPRIAPQPCLASSPRKSPGRDKIYDSSQTHSTHKSNGTPCPCYICKNSGDGKLQRPRSSSVPPGETSLKEIDNESEYNQTSSKYMSNPNISQNRFKSDRFDRRSSDIENSSAPPRVSRSNFNIGHLTAHGRVEHYV